MKRLALLFFAVVMLASPANAEPTALQTRLETLSSNGSGEAAYHLGMVYHMGLEGTAKDPKKAFELFKLSAERGDPFGAYMPAPKVVKDEAKGWAYLLLSVQEIPEIKSGFEAELSKLTPEVQARAKALAAAWKRKPSALDDSEGISAAYKLVGLPVPKK